MAMSAVYTCVDGELFSEVRGGVETLYEPDTLGSLIEARDASGMKTYEARYWPYGEVRSETGTNPSPWGFVGLLGYLTDLADLLYVRMRHYRPSLARWQTVDPLWPVESAYVYSSDAPVMWSDPTGQSPVIPIACAGACAASAICITDLILACWDHSGFSSFTDCAWRTFRELPTWLQLACGIGIGGCISCLAAWLYKIWKKKKCKALTIAYHFFAQVTEFRSIRERILGLAVPQIVAPPLVSKPKYGQDVVPQGGRYTRLGVQIPLPAQVLI